MKNLKFDPKNWDWYAFLDASEEVKEEYYSSATVLSKSWARCACGQVCYDLPRRYDGAPVDLRARHLGYGFNSNIHLENWDAAKITLDKIEARTAFLLQRPNFIDPKTF